MIHILEVVEYFSWRIEKNDTFLYILLCTFNFEHCKLHLMSDTIVAIVLSRFRIYAGLYIEEYDDYIGLLKLEGNNNNINTHTRFIMLVCKNTTQWRFL